MICSMLVNASNKCRLECSLQSEGFNYMFSLRTTSTSFNLNNAHKGKKEKKRGFLISKHYHSQTQPYSHCIEHSEIVTGMKTTKIK